MRGNPYVFSDFRGGVNLKAAPYSIDSGQNREALNMNSTITGSMKKRNGTSLQAALTDQLSNAHSIFPCNFTSGDLFLLVQGGTFWRATTSSETIEAIMEEEDIGTLDSSAHWEWVQAPESGEEGPIWGINGVDNPSQWDGEGKVKKWTAAEGSIPNGKCIAYHDNRIYIAKGSTLYWSDITNPRIFSSPKGGSTLFDPEDGEEITGIGKVGNYLLVTKQRKSFVMFDSNTGAYRRFSDGTGCIANRSIVSSPYGTLFMTAESQIVITDGNSLTIVSDPVEPLLKAIPGPMRSKVAGTFFGDSYFLSISKEGNINNVILEFNLADKSWWVHGVDALAWAAEVWDEEHSAEDILNYNDTSTLFIAPSQWAIVDQEGDPRLYGISSFIYEQVTEEEEEEEVVVGNKNIGLLLRYFVPNRYFDLGKVSLGGIDSVYTSYWVSPWHVFTYPHLRKIVREIRVDAKGTYDLFTARSFSTQVVKEEYKNWESIGEETIFGGEGEFGGTGVFGDEAPITEKRFYTPGIGRAWSLKFESKAAQELEIYAYTTAIQYKKD